MIAVIRFSRALIFNILLYVWAALYGLLLVPFLALPPTVLYPMAAVWNRGTIWMLGVVVGLRYELRGIENLPAGPAVVAVKHHSAWETIVFPVIVKDGIFILKKELLVIPLFGWALARMGMIGVDRSAGAAALKTMVARAAGVLAHGHKIIVFPEGTRVAPGQRHPYHPGVSALYGILKAPVVPVAVNSGLYWGRRAFFKRPGTIIVEFLPAIAPGLKRRAFMAELETRIETATERLLAEAETGIKVETGAETGTKAGAETGAKTGTETHGDRAAQGSGESRPGGA